MGHDEFVGNGQTDAAAWGPRGGPATIEAFEDPRKILGVDAVTGIGDLDVSVAVGDAGLDGDDAPGRRVRERVGEQRHQDLSEAGLVGDHGCGLDVGGDGQVGRLRGRADKFRDRGGGRPEVDTLAMQVNTADLDWNFNAAFYGSLYDELKK